MKKKEAGADVGSMEFIGRSPQRDLGSGKKKFKASITIADTQGGEGRRSPQLRTGQGREGRWAWCPTRNESFLVLLSEEVSEWDPVRSSSAKWEPAPGSAGDYDPTKERLVCRQLPPGGRDVSSGVKAKSCTHEE